MRIAQSPLTIRSPPKPYPECTINLRAPPASSPKEEKDYSLNGSGVGTGAARSIIGNCQAKTYWSTFGYRAPLHRSDTGGPYFRHLPTLQGYQAISAHIVDGKILLLLTLHGIQSLRCSLDLVKAGTRGYDNPNWRISLRNEGSHLSSHGYRGQKH